MKKKREFWPYAIILVLATFMSGILYGVTVMVRQDVPMVADDYYAQELVYQSRIDKEQRVLDDARTPRLRVLRATSALEVEYPGLNPELQTIKGKITFQRPSNPSRDFSVTVRPGTDGKQWISLRSIDKGLWLAQFEFEVDGKEYYYEQAIEL